MECDKPLVWDPGGFDLLGLTSKAHESTCNLKEQFNKMKNVMDLWCNRSLTLMGKVLIVNSLMGSLFLYKTQVSEDPTDVKYNLFEALVHQFLWGNRKRPKIKPVLLQAKRKNGGLKLFNLKFKVQACKVKWLFTESNFFITLLTEYIPELLGILFWMCNIAKKDVVQILSPHMPLFWKQVCEHWFDISYCKNPTGVEEIGYQIIWFNSNICGGNTLFWCPNWARKGLIYVYQLFTKNGKVKQLDEIVQEYGKGLNWLQFGA